MEELTTFCSLLQSSLHLIMPGLVSRHMEARGSKNMDGSTWVEVLWKKPQRTYPLSECPDRIFGCIRINVKIIDEKIYKLSVTMEQNGSQHDPPYPLTGATNHWVEFEVPVTVTNYLSSSSNNMCLDDFEHVSSVPGKHLLLMHTAKDIGHAVDKMHGVSVTKYIAWMKKVAEQAR